MLDGVGVVATQDGTLRAQQPAPPFVPYGLRQPLGESRERGALPGSTAGIAGEEPFPAPKLGHRLRAGTDQRPERAVLDEVDGSGGSQPGPQDVEAPLDTQEIAFGRERPIRLAAGAQPRDVVPPSRGQSGEREQILASVQPTREP